ncbi:GPI mannosyltransferase 2 [Massariosphaeria phaeospora]|uniref:GPI mannosyltransferase 2 n=1 Tax=Massariosphaeria phaeospora TaxID=100035 RepID=A0A7C8I368_9PLEO|nr:GPI mannosyltransferase 2 [Massariosphaeria phaeospora]
MSNVSLRLPRNLVARLVVVFVAWKAALLLLAAFAPGPGYDTSGLILSSDSTHRHADFQSWALPSRLMLKLLRWDALYFVKAAQRGYHYEQEWAFSWANSRILHVAGQCLGRYSTLLPLHHYVWAGIAVSHLCHLISVLILFRLLNVIMGHQQHSPIPFIASILHILSPAALFLSAPYTEALFSMANFAGMLHYALARSTARASKTWSIYQDAYMLSSGALFGFATLIRSNGLLSGLIFLYDAASLIPRIWSMQISRHEARRLLVTCFAGLLIAVGFVAPQYLAYEQYCVTGSPSPHLRPWCHKSIPSVYSWVQSNYWNVGFLRYWTLPNLPLFLVAAPMLWLLFESSVTVLRYPTSHLHIPRTIPAADTQDLDTELCILPQLALPQLVLAIAAVTNFHVQIINRLSSGYPIWYFVIAQRMVKSHAIQNDGKKERLLQWTVRGMIMYAMIQGMLFANFLPPA